MADVGVRAARHEDVAAVTGTQIRAWKYGYRDFLPEGPLEQMTGPAAEKMWRQQWEDAITSPPSRRHRVLVAVEQVVLDTDAFPALGPGGIEAMAALQGAEKVAGLASHAPAEDPRPRPDHRRGDAHVPDRPRPRPARTRQPAAERHGRLPP
ncbi:hypothetical protein [Streptosporangium vulgare]|uniref:hypothetical protein n=1 Tax=Streptosporangium vulgare TaxID=46190 RepID=UPI0031D26E85